MIERDCHASLTMTIRSKKELDMNTHKGYRIFLALICLTCWH